MNNKPGDGEYSHTQKDFKLEILDRGNKVKMVTFSNSKLCALLLYLILLLVILIGKMIIR